MGANSMRDLAEVLRDGPYLADRVLATLDDGPKTIPEISGLLRRPSREVTLWVMELRRYGRISEMPRAPTDEYYRYRRAGGTR